MSEAVLMALPIFHRTMLPDIVIATNRQWDMSVDIEGELKKGTSEAENWHLPQYLSGGTANLSTEVGS